jgi:catechol 2,3-dioxygenase-like lactoylglutathione lyase family enzyme
MDNIVPDHVAIAVWSWADAWPNYVGALGGRWSSGGVNVDFAPAQLRYANGAKVEVLQPHGNSPGSFLNRFLERSGPGPHHITFKVPDIRALLEQASAAGFDPVGVNLATPWWMEAFFHPKQAPGIVVQVAQAAGEWTSPAPEGFPEPVNEPASLLRIVHAVNSPERALLLFRDLLGGEVREVDQPEEAKTAAVELTWDAPLEIRLVWPAPRDSARATANPTLRDWLAGRDGAMHHLTFQMPTLGGAGPDPRPPSVGTPTSPALPAHPPRGRDDPSLAGEDPGSRVLVVEPDSNLGTRLVLLYGAP